MVCHTSEADFIAGELLTLFVYVKADRLAYVVIRVGFLAYVKLVGHASVMMQNEALDHVDPGVAYARQIVQIVNFSKDALVHE